MIYGGMGMNDLQGQPSELRMVVSITRKATGVTETYEITGYLAPEDEQTLLKENDDGLNPLDSRA